MLKPGTHRQSARIEHPCVREPGKAASRGRLATARDRRWTREGRVDLADYSAALAEHPRLVSVMLANNEVGVVQDTAALAACAHGRFGRAACRCGAGPGQGQGGLPHPRRPCADAVVAQDQRPPGRGRRWSSTSASNCSR
ncbi:MAG: aminotransferase class V-fold PLP-dependent enzyme [Comamonadaceae bacterium]|nr:aminotransferase class V-fold PLP-dependent enzyme [Comamonadaceae bacterium]